MVVMIGGLASCGGGGASSETAGATVNLEARITPTVNATVVNSEGTQITLSKAYLAIWSVELNALCTDPAFVLLPRHLLELLIPTAQAHAESTPTKLGVPHVFDLLDAAASTRVLGTLNPAVGSYCGLTVELIRADSDAVGLPRDLNMVNRLVYLSGSWRRDDGEDIPFEIDLSKSGVPAKRVLRPSLVLSARNLSATIGIAIDSARWFDGLDFTQLDTTIQQDLLLQNIRASISTF
ncbi:MAG: hypothetical protein ACFCUJ_02910 [Thiotrichales bacterium]